MTDFQDFLTQRQIEFQLTPSGLHVPHTIRLDSGEPVLLPEGLTVHGFLLVTGRGITQLPERLTVHNGLLLQTDAITALPEDLHVGGDLHLTNTRVQRFPRRMHVQGHILPPVDHLLDLRAFVAQKDGHLAMGPGMSRHQHLELRARMQAYPDLLRVVESIVPTMGIRLYQSRFGDPVFQIQPRLE